MESFDIAKTCSRSGGLRCLLIAVVFVTDVEQFAVDLSTAPQWSRAVRALQSRVSSSFARCRHRPQLHHRPTGVDTVRHGCRQGIAHSADFITVLSPRHSSGFKNKKVNYCKQIARQHSCHNFFFVQGSEVDLGDAWARPLWWGRGWHRWKTPPPPGLPRQNCSF